MSVKPLLSQKFRTSNKNPRFIEEARDIDVCIGCGRTTELARNRNYCYDCIDNYPRYINALYNAPNITYIDKDGDAIPLDLTEIIK